MNNKQYTRRVDELILVPPGWSPEHPMPIAIDPAGCGCTECLTGLYVPVDEATDGQLMLMYQGKIANNTGLVWVSDPDHKLD